MSGVNGIDAGLGARLDLGGLARFIPEPKNSASQGFGQLMAGLGGLVGKAAGAAAGGAGLGLPPELTSLLQQQIEFQLQMQQVSLISNVEKAKHESAMAPIRNIRVG